LIVQTGEVRKKLIPQGRFLIEPSFYAPVLSRFTDDKRPWNKTGGKLIFNEPGGEFTISYMVSSKLKIGFCGKLYRYRYEDTLALGSDNLDQELAMPEIFCVGPKIGYYFTTGSFKPFVDLSLGYFIFSPNFGKHIGLSIKEFEKRKNLKKESGVLIDISLGCDIRLWRYLDLRVAPRFMTAQTKPLSGSGNLNVGFVFHVGKGFPEKK
jgi:hypothetical protein